MRITDALDRFLVQLDADGRSVHTRKQYERHVGLLDHWFDSTGHAHSIERVDHETVAAFLSSPMARNRPDGKPKRATAMNALRTSLRTFFRFAHAAGYVSQDPARLVKRALTSAGPPRFLSDTDREKLLRALKVAQGFEAERDFALVQFLLLTGARIGSTLVLDIEDLDLAAGEATLKCKADRTERLFLNAEVVGHLRTWIGRRTTGPVFTTRNGRRLTSRQFARRLGQWSTQAGIQRSVSPHCLRHSFAMRVLEKTGDLLLTQAALGHRSIASTMAYVRVDPARLRRALA